MEDKTVIEQKLREKAKKRALSMARELEAMGLSVEQQLSVLDLLAKEIDFTGSMLLDAVKEYSDGR